MDENTTHLAEIAMTLKETREEIARLREEQRIANLIQFGVHGFVEGAQELGPFWAEIIRRLDVMNIVERNR